MNGPRRLSAWAFYSLLVLSLGFPGLTAAAPAIGNLSLRGLQAGGKTTLTLTGSELGPTSKLLLPVPIAEQTLAAGAAAGSVTFEVTLDADVPPGIYPLRVVTATGISPAALIAIDALPQTPLTDKVDAVPVALHGNLSGSTKTRCSFPGKQGQKIVVEVESQRLGGKLDPVVRLFDSRGVQLAWGQASVALAGDARLEVTLPGDGIYTAELHDALFRAPASPFRLKIGEFRYADLVYPLAAKRGTEASVEAVGANLPEGTRLTGKVQGNVAAPLSAPQGLELSGSSPTIQISDVAEVTEPDSAGSPHEVPAPPLGISGRLSEPGQEDVYKLPVAAGAKLRFELYAARIGSPLDGVLSIRNEKNNQLANSDDRPDTVDPGLDFTVPGGVSVLHIAVKDLVGQGGKDFIYRLLITPVDQPAVTVRSELDRLSLPRGGNLLFPVNVERKGYAGPIKLNLAGLPEGVRVSGAEIPAGTSQALLTLTPLADVVVAEGNSPTAVVASLTAEAAEGNSELPISVLLGNDGAVPSWLRNQLAVAIVEPLPLAVVWQDAAADAKLVTGQKMPLKVTLVRGENAAGPVRLTLVASQKTPRKTVKKDNKDVQEDDLAKALRLAEEVTLPAEATDGNLTLLIPPDLPKLNYDLAIKAEQLGADGKTVVRAAVTPALRLEAVDPAAEQPVALFAEQAEQLAGLDQGTGEAALFTEDKFAGAASAKVTGQQRFNPTLPNMAYKIREYPGPGEYRFLQFAWKKQGGDAVAIQLAHDGKFGPQDGKPETFRYHSGKAEMVFGGSLRVSDKTPGEWTVVTRDLFQDFGEFTLTGFSLAPVDGEFALYDQIHLGRSPVDFKLLAPAAP